VATAETTPGPPRIDAPFSRPELLAPAGDRLCLTAAIENGADAVYFGLQTHNARARASNFHLDELPDVMAQLHGRGARGYVTLNTLVFPREMEGVEALLRRVSDSGVDALIMQDLGLCRLAKMVAPELELHASTQMSVTSLEGVELARELGCSRVILARELSIKEIARIASQATLPLEVFVHGALCVAYSGQCLTSEALGGRSANRGECAQACRMPYEVIRDGQRVDLGDVKYLLSPQDLAAFDLVPDLMAVGVSSLKIEGRLKTPEYVANITSAYRRAIDDAARGAETTFSRSEIQDMEMSFSRGFSHGFLDGNNHKVLVRGDYAKKRGIFLGRVRSVTASSVSLELNAPVKAGDGVVFDGDDASGVPEQGGRVYETAPLRGGLTELRFGRRDIDLKQVKAGQRIWKTDDPALSKRLRSTFSGPPRRKVALDVRIEAKSGHPLVLEATSADGRSVRVASDESLKVAENRQATRDALAEQLDRLGGSVYRLNAVDATIEGGPLVPSSLLNALRRNLVEQLDILAATPPSRTTAPEPVLPVMRTALRDQSRNEPPGPVNLSALCRTTEQALAAVECGTRDVYLDYQDIKEYAGALASVRQAAPGARVWLATPRIEKPGEAPLFRYLDKQGADGLLVRNAGGLFFCAERSIPFVADFSLNAANELTAALLKSRGALRVTASYDLSFEQLDDMLQIAPPEWLEVVIHQYMPMFHMEHCVFCAFLSPGTDKTNCGRPCDRLDVKLRDRVGMEHPLRADVGCRNTLFHAVPQSAAEHLSTLVALGARHFRIEFLGEEADSVRRILGLYRDATEGRRDPRGLWRDLKATSQYGVTRGQLAVLG
jgi:putative protease